MRIAYILYPEVIISNKSNGIRSQAETWAKSLIEAGHVVDFVNNWDNYDWSDYNVIHLFGGGAWAEPVTRRLSSFNSNIVFSPIVDPSPNFNYKKAIIKNMLSRKSGGFFASNHVKYGEPFKYAKVVLARSDYESEFVNKIYNVPKEKIKIIRLSYSSSCIKTDDPIVKEPFCLHISSISQPRKNVIRLIEASNKYKFRLVLAGNTGSEEQFMPLKNAIGNNRNINVLGYISEEEKIKLYKTASVFALPSLIEGVGIVSLDAAFYGCNIIITNIPGPKEYYKGMCIECNPTDVDSIGRGIMDFIDNKVNFQPELSEFVLSEYSPNRLCHKLIDLYNGL